MWKYPQLGFRDSNMEFVYLQIELDARKPSYGWAPPYWQRDVGHVFAMREDGKDLTKRDISMLCHYATDRMQPLLKLRWRGILLGESA
ncbi:uncharacterized protein BDV14DRAFT_180325 [Aspergillus stella-maris]|uniref:uncharacterized protein n=1 Tax=Aspergillus stella-maris TaxID=1810926 RepID=UPI003CCE1A72